MSNLWLSVEPHERWTRLMLCESLVGPSLKALLPPIPAQNGAMAMFLEAMCAWYGRPLCAVLDADAPDFQRRSSAGLTTSVIGNPNITVEWVSPSSESPERGRFFAQMGDFRRARRLIRLAATGQR